jgi:hypothetical protein
MAKLPKSLGACVDLYHKMRAKRLLADKESREMKAEETAISNHIIDNLSKKDERGAVGKEYKAVVKNEDIYQVEDWDAFYAHIKKTGEFDLLNRALNQAAVKERVASQNRPTGKRGENWKPKLPPGIKTFTTVKLSVTKV